MNEKLWLWLPYAQRESSKDEEKERDNNLLSIRLFF